MTIPHYIIYVIQYARNITVWNVYARSDNMFWLQVGIGGISPIGAIGQELKLEINLKIERA